MAFDLKNFTAQDVAHTVRKVANFTGESLTVKYNIDHKKQRALESAAANKDEKAAGAKKKPSGDHFKGGRSKRGRRGATAAAKFEPTFTPDTEKMVSEAVYKDLLQVTKATLKKKYGDKAVYVECNELSARGVIDVDTFERLKSARKAEEVWTSEANADFVAFGDIMRCPARLNELVKELPDLKKKEEANEKPDDKAPAAKEDDDKTNSAASTPASPDATASAATASAASGSE